MHAAQPMSYLERAELNARSIPGPGEYNVDEAARFVESRMFDNSKKYIANLWRSAEAWNSDEVPESSTW